MNQIAFAKNWNNKLDKPTFTTIRGHTHQKEDYYQKQKGKLMSVRIRGKEYCKATLKDALYYANGINGLPLELLREDTGLKTEKEIHALFKKFGLNPNTPCLLLKFERETELMK